MTVNGKTMGDNCRDATIEDERVIKRFDQPLLKDAGFIVLSGNLFDAAIMKTSVISDEFRQRYLSNPDDPEAFEGPAVVFDGPEDYHERIDDPALNITPQTLMFMKTPQKNTTETFVFIYSWDFWRGIFWRWETLAENFWRGDFWRGDCGGDFGGLCKPNSL